MTLRTITSPYDSLTISEIQTEIAAHEGVTWANLSDTFKTVAGRIIDSSAEYLVKRFGDQPWMIHEESLSLASGTATLSLSVAARHVIRIIETHSGTTRTVTPATKKDYFDAWGSGATTHPWQTQTDPHWIIDGMTSDNPPQIQMRRVPTPDSAVTGTALVRPYMTLRADSGDQTYTHIPPAAQTAQMDYILARIDKFKKDYASAAQHKQWMEDEISTQEISDTEEGWEAPTRVGEPGWVHTEIEP